MKEYSPSDYKSEITITLKDRSRTNTATIPVKKPKEAFDFLVKALEKRLKEGGL